MIDYLAIGITHSLLLIMAWKLVMRSDLDADPAPPHSGEAGNNP